jgi:(2Fe-2S) ferredoxin
VETSPLPYKQLIFVCTNSRAPGERISCAGEGRCGQQVLDQLKKYVSQHDLKKNVRVAKSGCQELCERGPSISVMPQNVCLTGVRTEDVPSIIETYLKPHRTI